jgi:ribosomal protein S18 acetylase RimI-like enzyme
MDRLGTIAPVSEAPSEALRILEEAERALDPASPVSAWVRAGNDRNREQIRDGTALGGLWIGPKDEAVGLALWSEQSRAGRHVVASLGDGFRSAPALASFVEALERRGPLRVLYGPIPGIDDAAVGAALRPLGFIAAERLDMVFPDASPVPAVPEVPGFPSRSLDRSDAAGLARVLQSAYARSSIDRWLFARTEGEEFGETAAAEILGTGVGTWRPDASFGIEADGRLVAATLVNEHDGPLLAEVIVDPAWRRRGFARHLVTRSVAAVRGLGLGTLRLVVTVGNDRAEPLYRSVGFVPTPMRGSLWIRLPEGVTGAAEGSSD